MFQVIGKWWEASGIEEEFLEWQVVLTPSRPTLWMRIL